VARTGGADQRRGSSRVHVGGHSEFSRGEGGGGQGRFGKHTYALARKIMCGLGQVGIAGVDPTPPD